MGVIIRGGPLAAWYFSPLLSVTSLSKLPVLAFVFVAELTFCVLLTVTKNFRSRCQVTTAPWKTSTNYIYIGYADTNNFKGQNLSYLLIGFILCHWTREFHTRTRRLFVSKTEKHSSLNLNIAGWWHFTLHETGTSSKRNTTISLLISNVSQIWFGVILWTYRSSKWWCVCAFFHTYR